MVSYLFSMLLVPERKEENSVVLSGVLARRNGVTEFPGDKEEGARTTKK